MGRKVTLGVAVTLAAVVVGLSVSTSKRGGSDEQQVEATARSSATAPVGSEPAKLEIAAAEAESHIETSKSDSQTAATMASDLTEPPEPVPVDEKARYRDERGRLITEGYGQLQPLDLSDLATNPQKDSVVEAFQTGEHPERLSIMAKRESFDANAWKNSEDYRQAYLSVVEPGRAYDPAQPAADVPRLRRAAPKFQEAFQGEAVSLAVQGAPHAPVTFTSADAAVFQNDLPTITVQADGNGFAAVELTATSGVAGNCRVSAASPMASATVIFILDASIKPQTEN